MADKEWGYLITLFKLDKDKKEVVDTRFEAEGISPYKMVAALYLNFMKSGDYDHISNTVALGSFVKSIGDKNTISIKKLKDSITDAITKIESNHQKFPSISIGVFRQKDVPRDLSGDPRITAISNNVFEVVWLNHVVPTYLWLGYEDEPNPTGKGYVTTMYDYIAFEGDNTAFRFKDVDFK